jgi:plastocyanin
LVLLSLGSVGVVSAHDEPVTGTAALTIKIGASLDPATARLAAGDIVEWVNTDDTRHRMRSTSGPVRFDSGYLERGEAFRIRVVAGTYVYSDHRDRDQASYHGRLAVSATGSGATSNGGSVPGGGEAAPPSTAHVTIADRAFGPADIAIAVGGTVDWVNRDDRAHTVTGGDGTFGSSTLEPGATLKETFATAGSFAYLCAIHPEMQGTIRVVAAAPAAAAPAAPDGEPAAVLPGSAAEAPVDSPAPAAATTTDVPANAPPADSAQAADDAASPAAATASVASTSVDGLARWLIVALLVTIGVALFARTVRGSIRPA